MKTVTAGTHTEDLEEGFIMADFEVKVTPTMEGKEAVSLRPFTVVPYEPVYGHSSTVQQDNQKELPTSYSITGQTMEEHAKTDTSTTKAVDNLTIWHANESRHGLGDAQGACLFRSPGCSFKSKTGGHPILSGFIFSG